jgi:hypothetical protein
MTPIEKYKDIDLSKLPEKAVEKVKEIAGYLNDSKLKNATDADSKEAYKAAENSMERLYSNIAEKYPESIKSKVAKAPEPKTPKAIAKKVAQASIVQPKKGKSTASAKPTKRADKMLLAQKIYKKGEETWQEAIKRANKILQEEKKSAVKNANKQYKKLQAFLAKHPIKKGATDIERDAPRKALPIGKRTAKKSGKTYYEYRENRTDRNRKGYPYLKLGGMLHGAGNFAKGGKIHDPADLYAQLNEAENNFSKDNGAEYNRLLALISENRANYYKALNEAENNFSKDNGAEYNRLYSMRNKFAKGGTLKKKDLFGDGGMKDLFEDYDNMPPKLRRIYDNNQDVFMDGGYAELEKVLKQMEAEGYTFDYGLSGEAYGLRPIGTNLNDLEGYEEFAKGGVVNYSIMDNRNGKVVKGGFATENEAKKHMYSLFEKSPKEAFYYSIKTEKFAKGGKMASKPFQKK